MTKHGGIANIVQLFRNRREDDGRRFLSRNLIATETGISETRVQRILSRNSVVRPSTGSRPNMWTLREFDS